MKRRRDEHLKKRFDRDGDGELNEEEQAALDEQKAKMEKQQAEMVKKYDADGDGKLNQEERRKMSSER